jgi:hypothetical protein
MTPDTITLTAIESAFEKKRWPLPAKEGEAVVYGVRSKNATADDRFECVIGVMWIHGGERKLAAFQGTTIPGVYWLKNLMSPAGTAILCEGYHKDSWEIGTHKGKPALVQRLPVPVYRDKNRDLNYDIDPSTIDIGMFGIDIHRAVLGGISTIIGQWSAGCQALSRSIDMDFILGICDNARVTFGNKFSYALLKESDLSQ